MKRLFVYASFAIAAILFIGLFTLNSETAGCWSVAIVLLSCFFAGTYFSERDLDLPRMAVLGLSSIGLVLYVALGLFLNPSNWYSPPTFCLLAFLIGFVAKRKYFLYAVLPCSVAAVFYAFWLLPQIFFLKNTIDPSAALRTNLSIDSSLQLMDKAGHNHVASMVGKVVLLETWNQYCGNCMEAMKDLHPFLSEMEEEHSDFEHYYIYTNNEADGAALEKYAFNNKRLPYNDMKILHDKDQMLFKKSKEQGVPQFFFINRDGEVKHLSIGYTNNYATAFKIFIKKTVGDLMGS